MWQKLNSRYSRRAFALILVLLLLVMVAILWYVNAKQSSLSKENFNFIQSLLLTLIASLLSATFMGAMYWFLLPKERQLQQIEEIDPQTTIQYFDDALDSTTYWGYHGHIGRWLRNAAFAALDRKAKAKGEVINVDVIIIDPLNVGVCGIFARYKSIIRFREKEQESAEDVRAELFATILMAIIANVSGSIKVRLFLTSGFSSLRKDISDNVIFLTRVDPRAPALMVKKEIGRRPIETSYAMFKTDFEFIKQQSKEVDLQGVGARISARSERSEVASALVELGFFTNPEALDDSLMNKIIKLLNSKYHPYN